MKANFWLNRKVLITGHTGFKGAWLTHYLLALGANVTGVARAPHTTPSLFDALELSNRCRNIFIDICDYELVKQTLFKEQPEVVFHLAAQAIVHVGFEAPHDTIHSNVQGALNILNALTNIDSVKVVLFVTTDKVYRASDFRNPFNELAALGGSDPYSASKSAADLIAQYYFKYILDDSINGIVLRAGNVIGGGDWAPMRLIPDMVRAWSKHSVLSLRMPDAIRPWQHVLEPTLAYTKIVEHIVENGSINLLPAYNIGPDKDDVLSVLDCVKIASGLYNNAPFVTRAETSKMKETKSLLLDNTRLKKDFGINPRWRTDEAIRNAILWYRNFEQGRSATYLCDRDIDLFCQSIT